MGAKKVPNPQWQGGLPGQHPKTRPDPAPKNAITYDSWPGFASEFKVWLQRTEEKSMGAEPNPLVPPFIPLPSI